MPIKHITLPFCYLRNDIFSLINQPSNNFSAVNLLAVTGLAEKPNLLSFTINTFDGNVHIFMYFVSGHKRLRR